MSRDNNLGCSLVSPRALHHSLDAQMSPSGRWRCLKIPGYHFSDRPLPLMQYLGLGKKEGAVKSAHFEHLGQLSFSERVKLHCNSDLSTSICFLKQDGQHGQKASFWKKTVFQGKLSLPEFLTKQASTMVFQGVWTSPIMWFFYSMTSGFLTDGATILPAPQNFSVRSTNMKHLLMWNPVTQPGETVFYFVQYQGEYESLYMSHIWIPSSQCSPTKGLECDVTDDVTATVPYNFRVMAMLGSQSSAWSNLEHPFNRNATVLTPPRMEVTEHGLHLVVELEDLGPQFEFLVVYWRMEPGAVERVKVVRSGDIPVHLETMDPGVMYCVKAQALVKTIGRHSAFSQPTCVEMQGESLPLALALFAFVGFVLILVVALLSVWKMGQLLRYSCCPAVVLPDTLKVTSSSQKLIRCRKEEVDACAVTVLSSEHLFGVWISQT